jgi:hypothetical protein
MGFLWKHKVFSLLLGLGLAYFFVNPLHKIGFATGNLVVYNRIPIFFFDAYIASDGSLKPLINISGADDRHDWMELLRNETPGEDFQLIVGTGFGRQSFLLSDTIALQLGARNISISQVPSALAVQQYNAAIDQHRKVAMLLSVRR